MAMTSSLGSIAKENTIMCRWSSFFIVKSNKTSNQNLQFEISRDISVCDKFNKWRHECVVYYKRKMSAFLCVYNSYTAILHWILMLTSTIIIIRSTRKGESPKVCTLYRILYLSTDERNHMFETARPNWQTTWRLQKRTVCHCHDCVKSVLKWNRNDFQLS